MQTNATDIGGRGCYVETLLPLPLGTKVKITFWMDSEKIQTSGVVRASDGGVGMGIEFTQLDNLGPGAAAEAPRETRRGLTRSDSAKGASNAILSSDSSRSLVLRTQNLNPERTGRHRIREPTGVRERTGDEDRNHLLSDLRWQRSRRH